MVNIHKPQLTSLQESILRFLFTKAGTHVNQHQIAVGLQVTQPAVKKALRLVEKKGYILIDKDKQTSRWSITCNRQSPRTMQLKRIDNLRRIYESGLADLLETRYAGGSIILFGSYALGEDTTRSDIDIAVVGRKEKSIDLSNYEHVLERTINIHFFGSFGKIHKNLKENLANGIILAGGFEL